MTLKLLNLGKDYSMGSRGTVHFKKNKEEDKEKRKKNTAKTSSKSVSKKRESLKSSNDLAK